MRPRELCDRIREVALNPQCAEADELDRLATEYAEHAREANRRLGRCSEWLRLGLRSEAIHDAEQAPDLLETVSALGLGSHMPAWKELCELNNVTLAPETNWAAAAELNTAYDTERTMERPLRRHRRAALVHAPLRERIGILRELREQDPDNSVWETSLVEFERARVTIINREARVAMKAERLDRLKQLEAELKSPLWTHLPPGRLVQEVVRARQQVQEHAAIEQYRELAGEIHDAMSAMNRPTIESLHGRWCEIDNSTGIAPPADLAEETRRVFEWLQQQRDQEHRDVEYERACRQLEEILDEGSTAGEIDRAMADVHRFERGIPDVLLSRARNRLAEHRLDRGRRFRLVAGGLVAVVLIVGGVITWLVRERSRERKLDNWVVKIAEAVESEQWDRASRLFGSVPSPHRETPELSGLWQRIAEHTEADRDRNVHFVAAIDAVEAAGVDNPNRDALQRAQQFATTEKQTLRVQAMADRIAAADAQSQRRRNDAFRQAFGEAQTSFDAIQHEIEQALGVSALRQLERDLETLGQTLDELLGRDGVSEGLVATGRAFRQGAARLQQDVADRATRRQARNTLLSAIESPPRTVETLVSNLSKFAEQFANTHLAGQFRDALRHADAWRSARDWSTVSSSTLQAKTVEFATTRRAVVQGFRDEQRPWPRDRHLATYLAYLDAAITILDDDERPSMRLRNVLANPIIAELSFTRTADGARVYTRRGEIKPITGGYNVTEAITAVDDLDAPRTMLIGPDRAVAEPKIEPSGQMLWAAAVNKVLQDLDARRWDIAYLEVIDMLLAEPDMDEILRFYLAQLLLQKHTRFAWFEDARVTDWLAAATAVDWQVPWLDPSLEPPAEVRASRMGAQSMLDRIPLPSELRSELLGRWAAVVDRLQPRRLAGLIWRDETGRRTIRSFGTGRRYEALSINSAGQYVFIDVATRQGKVVELLPAAENVPYGTPVFVR